MNAADVLKIEMEHDGRSGFNVFAIGLVARPRDADLETLVLIGKGKG